MGCRILSFILTGLLVACSAEEISTTTSSTTTPPSTTTTLAPDEALRRFADCLEERGVVVPDLGDGSGRPDFSGLALSNDPASAGFRAALDDCAFLLVGNGMLALIEQPELAAAVMRQLQRFTTCMRESGVEDFPEPDPAFDGSLPPYPTTAIPADDPDLAAAIETCVTLLGMAPLTG